MYQAIIYPYFCHSISKHLLLGCTLSNSWLFPAIFECTYTGLPSQKTAKVPWTTPKYQINNLGGGPNKQESWKVLTLINRWVIINRGGLEFEEWLQMIMQGWKEQKHVVITHKTYQKLMFESDKMWRCNFNNESRKVKRRRAP